MIPYGSDDPHVCDTALITEYPNGDTVLSCADCHNPLAYFPSEGTPHE